MHRKIILGPSADESKAGDNPIGIVIPSEADLWPTRDLSSPSPSTSHHDLHALTTGCSRWLRLPTQATMGAKEFRSSGQTGEHVPCELSFSLCFASRHYFPQTQRRRIRSPSGTRKESRTATWLCGRIAERKSPMASLHRSKRKGE